MIEEIRNYVKDLEFRFTVYQNKVDIINYQKIVSLEDEKIIFLANNEKITIYGQKLTLNKLLEQEVLITGKILKIEVDYE